MYPPIVKSEIKAIKSATSGASAYLGCVRGLVSATTEGDRTQTEHRLELLFLNFVPQPDKVPGHLTSFGEVQHLIGAVSRPRNLELPSLSERHHDPGYFAYLNQIFARCGKPTYTDEFWVERGKAFSKLYDRTTFGSAHEVALHLWDYMFAAVCFAGISEGDKGLSTSKWQSLRDDLSGLSDFDFDELEGSLRSESNEAMVYARTNIPTSPPIVGSGAEPNDTGCVRDPPDPTAYIPQAAVLANELPEGLWLTDKHMTRILEDYNKNQVRWTRPLGSDGTPRYNRRNVHLADWKRYVNEKKEPDSDPTPEEIEKKTAELRATKKK